MYLDPAAREFFVDYDRMAADAAAMLRLEAGRNPHDKALITLVGELSTQSELFRQHWASHNVRFHVNGVKRFHHPVAGDLSLNFERLDLAADNAFRARHNAEASRHKAMAAGRAAAASLRRSADRSASRRHTSGSPRTAFARTNTASMRQSIADSRRRTTEWLSGCGN